MEQLKQCGGATGKKYCGQWLPLALFSKNKCTSDGFQNYCKDCFRKACAQSHARKPEVRIRSLAMQRERRAANWQRLFELKGSKCLHCPFDENIPDCYDMHHVDPTEKEFGLAKIMDRKDWGRIEKEAEKCILLCAICHRKEHLRLRREAYEIN